MRNAKAKSGGEKLRYSCLAFLLLFVGLQTFSVMHAANYGNKVHHHEVTVTQPDEHGDSPHTHEGPVCEIFLLSEKNKFAGLVADSSFDCLALASEQTAHPAEPYLQRILNPGTFARAPPISLHS